MALTEAWHTAADWVVPPLAAILTAVVGWHFGRTRMRAQTESYTTQASLTAVQTLVATIDVLRSEVEHLKGEVERLKGSNNDLARENKELREALAELRRIFQGADHYRGFYEDRPDWGGSSKREGLDDA